MSTKNEKVNKFVEAMKSGIPQHREPKEELTEDTVEKLKISPELKEALNRERTRNVGRPKKGEHKNKEGEIRATFIVNKDKVRKLKYISLMDSKLLKNVIDEALSSYISKWEEINGIIDFKNIAEE